MMTAQSRESPTITHPTPPLEYQRLSPWKFSVALQTEAKTAPGALVRWEKAKVEKFLAAKQVSPDPSNTLSCNSQVDPVIEKVLSRLAQGLPPTDDAELLDLASKVVEGGFEVQDWSQWARNLAESANHVDD